MPSTIRPYASVAAAFLALAACAAGAAGARGASAMPASDAAAAPVVAPARELWGFTAFWDPRSTASLTSHGVALDVAVTTWISLDSITGEPGVQHAAPHRRGGAGRSMALVTSWQRDRFHPAAVRRLAADPARLRAGAARMAREAVRLGHRGLVLDFEGHEAADTAALRSVVAAFAHAARDAGAGPVSVCIPATDTLAYPARLFIGAGAAFVLPMLYDQHWAGGTAGPVAAPAWVRRWLDVRVREVGAGRVVAGLPLYGYRWPASGTGETVTYAEAVALVARAGTRLTRDSASATLRATLPDGQVWVTDAHVLGRLVDEARRAGVSRVAVWYVGQEDPAAWAVLQRR